MQHIYCKPRFVNVLAYFRRLEQMLELFGIYSNVPEDSAPPIETKKEARKIKAD